MNNLSFQSTKKAIKLILLATAILLASGWFTPNWVRGDRSRADAVFKEGWALYKNENFLDAMERLEEAVELYEKGKYHYRKLDGWLYAQDNLREAKKCCEDTLVRLVDSTGNEAKYTYDEFGRLTEVSLPDGSTIDYTYQDTRDNGTRMSVAMKPGI